MEWLPALVGLAGATVTLVGIIAARRQTRATASKTDAEATAILKDTALDLIAPLRGEIDRVTTRLHELEQRVDTAETDRDILAALVRRVIEWEDAGRPDPPGPPTTDPVIRALLASLPDR